MRLFVATIAYFCIFFSWNAVHAIPCAFCKHEIIEGQSVLKTKHFNVLVDYEPHVKGHLLVIPQRHIVKAHELTKEEWEELSFIIPSAVKVFSTALNTDDYVILEKNGRRAFQHVPHVHFHLLPITNQKWREIFDIMPKRLSQKELATEVELFRSYFANVD